MVAIYPIGLHLTAYAIQRQCTWWKRELIWSISEIFSVMNQLKPRKYMLRQIPKYGAKLLKRWKAKQRPFRCRTGMRIRISWVFSIAWDNYVEWKSSDLLIIRRIWGFSIHNTIFIIKHSVSWWVVMLASAVSAPLCAVPNVCKLAHRSRLFVVELLKEVGVNRSAKAVYSCPVKVQGFCDKAFVWSHKVRKVSQR